MKNVNLMVGDCVERMRSVADNSVDSVVTDPPYELGFMGKAWDSTGIANSVEMWKEALRVLKPGGHLLAFSGSRTYHRMTCAIEDAGFEVRDQIMWVYGSGFPKSLDVSKAIDKAAGAVREVVGVAKGKGGENLNVLARANGNDGDEAKGCGAYGIGAKQVTIDIPITAPATELAQQWQGWGTALKPAFEPLVVAMKPPASLDASVKHEPICVARKPLAKGNTVAANVLQFGTGALNIDGCRVGMGSEVIKTVQGGKEGGGFDVGSSDATRHSTFESHSLGRWPANLIHSGCQEVLDLFPDSNGSGPARKLNRSAKTEQDGWGMNSKAADVVSMPDAGTGSAARFFKKVNKETEWQDQNQPSIGRKLYYCAKTSKKDRGEGNNHPTVKPTDLMRYLVRLVTPPNGTVLDPFMGSGSTGKAAIAEGFNFIGIDMDEAYVAIAKARMGVVSEELVEA